MISLFRYFRRKTKAHHVDAYSAQAAFFLLFSFMPLILLVFFAVKSFAISRETVIDTLNYFFPPFLKQWISEIMQDVFSQYAIGTTWFSLIAVVWSASKCVYHIIGGLNTIFELKEHRTFFHVRFLSILYTFVFIFAIAFTILLMVFGSYFFKRATDLIPSVSKYYLVISATRYTLGIFILTLFFSCLYKTLPAKKFSVGDMLPGAIVSAVGWIAFSSMFELYLENFANYSNVYGGLTSIIVFILWLYFCMQILFFGAEINLLVQKLNQHKLY